MSPQPPRQPGWTCGICGTWNESFRGACRNASQHQPQPQEGEEE